MRKQYRHLALATSREDWQQLDNVLRDSVGKLCDHGDYDKAEALFGLIDLLTNEKYDAQNRGLLAFDALREAFRYTKTFDDAVNAETVRVNPIEIRKTA